MPTEVKVFQYTQEELEALFDKAAEKGVEKALTIFEKRLEENNLDLANKIGQNMRSIVREEIDKAFDERLEPLVERKIEEKIKNVHLTVS